MPILRDLFGVQKPLIAMCHLEGLPGRQARDYYERTRERGERLMLGVSVALALAAVAALVATVGRAS